MLEEKGIALVLRQRGEVAPELLPSLGLKGLGEGAVLLRGQGILEGLRLGLAFLAARMVDALAPRNPEEIELRVLAASEPVHRGKSRRKGLSGNVLGIAPVRNAAEDKPVHRCQVAPV